LQLTSLFLFDQQRRVLIWLPGERLGEQSSLQFEAATICRSITEKRMDHFFVEPLLKLGEEDLTLYTSYN
jgi:hypothetical protein